MTSPVEVPELSEDFDVYELGAIAKARKVRIQQCNGQLQEIRSIDGGAAGVLTAADHSPPAATATKQD